VSQDSDPQDPPPNQPTSARFRLVLLVVLLVVLVASTGAVAYLAATRPVSVAGIEIQGSQDKLQTQRDEVMQQAQQFMLRLNTYGPDLLDGDTMPQYRKLVEEVITSKFAVDFEKNVTTAEALVKQSGVGRTAQVFSAGVSSIDSDSATALVAGSITQSYPRKPGSSDRVPTEPASFRVEVKLVNIHGTWLVDDFSPLTGDDGNTSGNPTELPSPSQVPSGSPSQGSSAPTDGSSP
jgi:hypothetical protein